MTPPALDDALAALGWSSRHLARQLGCGETLVRRWVSGGAPVPAPVAAWLTRLAATHQRHPPPLDWRTRAAA